MAIVTLPINPIDMILKAAHQVQVQVQAQLQVAGLPGSDNLLVLLFYALGGAGLVSALIAAAVNTAKNRNDGQAAYRTTLLNDITNLRKELKEALEALQAARLENVKLSADLADARHDIERLSEDLGAMKAQMEKQPINQNNENGGTAKQ